MNDNDEKKLNVLKGNNPFVSSSVGDPWENQYPDVTAINESAFNGIFQLIDQKTKKLALPCAGLVFGEVGSGKTHLIGRLLKHSRNSKTPFSFAYIQPIEDPGQTYRYLLRELIINLCFPTDKMSPTTQLDRILENIFTELKHAGIQKSDKIDFYLSDLRTDISEAFRKTKNSLRLIMELMKVCKSFIEKLVHAPAESSVNAVDFLRAKFPDVPKSFIKVLLQYQIPPKRPAVIDWLKGIAIDESDAALLGVSSRENASPFLEEEAKNVIRWMGILLIHYGHPLAVCFDRLENYDTDEKILSLGKMIEFLVDNAKAMLPLVFVRGQQWNEKLSLKFNQHVITRLMTNEFSLKGCSADQSLEIIRTRLATVMDAADANRLFPFDAGALKSTFESHLHSPRQVIMIANQQLKGILYPEKISIPKPASALDKLQKEFEMLCDTIRSDPDRYPPDRSRLRRALELYLTSNSDDMGIEIDAFRHPDDRFMDLEIRMLTPDQTPVHAMFIIDVEQNNSSVRASIKRGIDFLEAQPQGKLIYIRDFRCPIPPPPKWKATNEMLEKFIERGGQLLTLDQDQICRWYALAILNYAVKEGDHTLAGVNNQPRSVSMDELAEFARQITHQHHFTGFMKIMGMLGMIVPGI